MSPSPGGAQLIALAELRVVWSIFVVAPNLISADKMSRKSDETVRSPNLTAGGAKVDDRRGTGPHDAQGGICAMGADKGYDQKEFVIGSH
jgi:hypothetical protein